jgi:hypothetical protein
VVGFFSSASPSATRTRSTREENAAHDQNPTEQETRRNEARVTSVGCPVAAAHPRGAAQHAEHDEGDAHCEESVRDELRPPEAERDPRTPGYWSVWWAAYLRHWTWPSCVLRSLYLKSSAPAHVHDRMSAGASLAASRQRCRRGRLGAIAPRYRVAGPGRPPALHGPMARLIATLRSGLFHDVGFADLLGSDRNAAVTAKSPGVKAVVDLSHMTVSQMSETETPSSPQQKQHWLAERMLRWSGHRFPLASSPAATRRIHACLKGSTGPLPGLLGRCS